MVYPYHRILFSNKEEYTIDTRNNLDESRKNYAEPNTKRLHVV